MFFDSLRKTVWAVVLSFGCLLASVVSGVPSAVEATITYGAENRMVISTWLDADKTPLHATWDGSDWSSPTVIPGARAGSSGITTTYDETNQTVVATWRNAQKIPTYAVWNGASWSTPAKRIPPLSRRRANSDVTTTYNAESQMIVAMWLNLSNTPVYTNWNGTMWSKPVAMTKEEGR